jgi:Na+/H+ antiporter NhaD/arsenite permease-like protein
MFTKELAVGILILVYGLMISEKVHRTVAVLLGAVMMVGLGVLSESDVIGYIHWEALGLIFGMFIIVAALSRSGFFRWVGLHVLMRTKFNPLMIFVLFSALSGLLAAFMDSITVMMFMAALTIEVCVILEVPVLPFLLSEICAANIGGAATMVGDPPNVLIGTSLGLGFTDFLVNVGPIAIVLFLVNILFLKYFFRKLWVKRDVDTRRIYQEHAELNPFHAVRNLRHMQLTLAVFAFTVTLLVLHQFLDMMVATVAITGATIVLLTSGERSSDIIEKIDWQTLLFLAGLFVVVGGLESVGVLADLAHAIVDVTGGEPILIVSLFLWTMAPVSAFLDNVPFAAAMIPVIREISASVGMQLSTLAWTLAIVSDVSGNATPIGASANVVGISVARKRGVHIHWKEYCRAAFPAMILCIAVANVLIVAMFLL